MSDKYIYASAAVAVAALEEIAEGWEDTLAGDVAKNALAKIYPGGGGLSPETEERRKAAIAEAERILREEVV